MTNRNSLLGRSKPSEKLTGEELAALNKVTVPPVLPAPPAKPPSTTVAEQMRIESRQSRAGEVRRW